MKSDERFIVAEVSKNWIDGQELTPGSGLLAQQFERVIDVNDARGYRLVEWRLQRTMTAPNAMNETIIAVFERAVRHAPPIFLCQVCDQTPERGHAPDCPGARNAPRD